MLWWTYNLQRAYPGSSLRSDATFSILSYHASDLLDRFNEYWIINIKLAVISFHESSFLAYYQQPHCNKSEIINEFYRGKENSTWPRKWILTSSEYKNVTWCNVIIAIHFLNEEKTRIKNTQMITVITVPIKIFDIQQVRKFLYIANLSEISSLVRVKREK
jgi:hypothetical protein